MSTKAFYSTAGTLFLIVAALHLIRALNGWKLIIGTYSVPIWASWVAVVVLGYLSYNGLKKK